MGKNRRVLIIDDEKWVVDSLEDALKQEGEFEVLVAYSGQQGLELAESGLPDAIVLDLVMPGLGGMEVCRMLKGNPATQAIPILLLTANHDVHSAVAAFQAGVSGYLLKPFDPKRLSKQIHEALGE